MPHTPSAPNTVAVALSHSHELSLPRSTLTITVCEVGLRDPSESILGQKSMSSPRSPPSAIAARAAREAFANPSIPTQVVPAQFGALSLASSPILMILTGKQIGWLPPEDAWPQSFL